MTGDIRRAAKTAEENTAFRVVARAGYVANGLLHGAIGVLIVVVACGGVGESDQTGAFKAVAAAPGGFLLLWAIAIGLCALGLWHAAAAVGARRMDPKKRLGRILAEAGQALAFIAIGVVSAATALGARPDAEEAAEGASRGVLAAPGGALLLGAVGLGVAVAGVSFVVMGVRRSFHNRMDLPDGPVGRALEALGVVGFVAKGIALTIVGVLLVVAAVTVEPSTAGALDGAVHALVQMPGGPALGVSVGVGFLAYGVFTVFRARYARLEA